MSWRRGVSTVRDQVEAYGRSRGHKASTFLASRLISGHHAGNKTRDTGNTALMRVEHVGQYGLVASKTAALATRSGTATSSPSG